MVIQEGIDHKVALLVEQECTSLGSQQQGHSWRDHQHKPDQRGKEFHASLHNQREEGSEHRHQGSRLMESTNPLDQGQYNFDHLGRVEDHDFHSFEEHLEEHKYLHSLQHHN